MTRHYAIFVPGLADKTHYVAGQRIALFLWRGSPVRTFYFTPHWANKRESFRGKLDRLLAVIDNAHKKGLTVSLIATSAGAGMALVAFYKRPEVVRKVISICGKLHHPETVPQALFDLNPAFKEALVRYARIEQHITAAQRRRILVVRAARDSYVPPRDGRVEGAHQLVMKSMGHVFSIFMAITIYRRRLIQFIVRTDDEQK